MTFLFDIGNVLLKLHFQRFHLAILGSENAPLPADLADLKDPYETGKLSDQEFVEQSLDILNHPLTSDEFVAAWKNIFSPNLPMWEVVRHSEEARPSPHSFLKHQRNPRPLISQNLSGF
jgi:putative hydrolase of the HAD superfamily